MVASYGVRVRRANSVPPATSEMNRETAFHLRLQTSLCISVICSVYAGYSVDSQGSKASSCGQQNLWSACADPQADLSLRWAHILIFYWSLNTFARFFIIFYKGQNFGDFLFAFLRTKPLMISSLHPPSTPAPSPTHFQTEESRVVSPLSIPRQIIFTWKDSFTFHSVRLRHKL